METTTMTFLHQCSCETASYVCSDSVIDYNTQEKGKTEALKSRAALQTAMFLTLRS
jgi:hypothetical protein